MTAKRVVLVLLVVGVILSVSALNAVKLTKSPYVIGAIFSVTGDNAPLGVPERETVKMLEKQINAAGGIDGHPVKVELYDDGGKPDQAVQACQELLANKKVVAIIGPTLSGTSLAIAPACQSAKVPLISAAASVKIVEPVRPFIFKTAQSDAMAVGRIIDYCLKRGFARIGFINDSNAFGASGREQWLILSKKKGIRTVALESFNTSDNDMTAQLTKIRAERPQAVICWGTNPGPAIVAQDMRRLGMKQTLLMSHGIANKQFIDLAKSAAEGVIFPAGKLIVADQIAANDPQRKTLLKYIADYKKATGKMPNTFGGHGYDAFKLVTMALGRVGSKKAKIRSAIENTKGFVGISGVFNFSPTDHNGLGKSSLALVTIKNGKWVLVK